MLLASIFFSSVCDVLHFCGSSSIVYVALNNIAWTSFFLGSTKSLSPVAKQ